MNRQPDLTELVFFLCQGAAFQMITPPLLDPMKTKEIITTPGCIYIAHQTIVLEPVYLRNNHCDLANEQALYPRLSKADIEIFKDEGAGPGGLWKIGFAAPKINTLATYLRLSVPHSSSKRPYSDGFLE
jgi:hypothetical protein